MTRYAEEDEEEKTSQIFDFLPIIQQEASSRGNYMNVPQLQSTTLARTLADTVN
jgi:ABC-type branched-subunit amino acid transport system ATPase component